MKFWTWLRGVFGSKQRAAPAPDAAPPTVPARARVAEPGEQPELPPQPRVASQRPTASAPPIAAAEPTARPSAPPQPRHLHFGMDFGTCWSKLVLRDYEAPSPRCFVVQPRSEFGGHGDYRVPSSVVIADRRLWFGWRGQEQANAPGAIVIHSPKMRAAFGDQAVADAVSLPIGATAYDLAALVVAYLLEIGRSAAEEYVTWLPGHHRPQITMTIGAPMSMLDSHHLGPKFLTIARTGFELFRALPRSILDGIALEDALQAVALARSRVAGKSVSEPREWVRSEAEAGLLWMFRSAAVPEGLYSCVDIGAGTTDVSFFRITSRHIDGTWQKHGMVFFSAESAPPAVDAIDEVLVRHRLAASVPAARGRELTLLAAANGSCEPEVRRVANDSFSVYRRAFSNGYAKHTSQTAWMHYGLFTLGGGSKLPCFQSAFAREVWDQLERPKAMNAGFPTDLFHWDRRLRFFDGDASFLLVAYGLSFQELDTPPTDPPHDVPPFTPLRERRRPLDPDEYWSE